MTRESCPERVNFHFSAMPQQRTGGQIHAVPLVHTWRRDGTEVTARDDAHVEFDALEYGDDDRFAETHLAFRTDAHGRWLVERNGRTTLELGDGYRLLRTRSCGVCSTDLDRRFLPFPLPQVIGHEAVVEDAEGRRFAVEINASHAARGEPPCAFCRAGLETHCPDRIVLGIHDLPGGFGPWILAPEHALVALPAVIPDVTAALVEPFAAALHAVTTIDPQPGMRVAVLGPRRLGLLVIAALAAFRRSTGRDYEIVAFTRRASLGAIAEDLGADASEPPPADAAAATATADVVVDTTGAPDGLALACALARHEVHLKSTHGQPALGCAHLTEAVVDEISFVGAPHADERALAERLRSVEPLATGDDRRRVGWLAAGPPPAGLAGEGFEIIEASDARSLLDELERDATAGDASDHPTGLPRVDALVLDDAARIDEALRPRPNQESSPLRPRGVLVLRTGPAGSPEAEDSALGSVLARRVSITTSRCGDFQQALALMADDPVLPALGDLLVTHHFGAGELPEAFEMARSRNAIKVVIDHAR